MKKSGFTLIETILAVTTIALVIVVTAELTQSSLRRARSSVVELSAHLRAQQGLEVVRNIRDTNWLQNSAWREGLKDGDYTLSFAVDGRASLAPVATVDDGEELKDFVGAPFKRIIHIESVKNDAGEVTGMRVKSSVQFSYLFGTKEVSLISDLTDWKKGPL